MKLQFTVRVTAIFALALLLGTPQAWALGATAGPILTMDPNGVTPLAGKIDLTTDVPSRVTIRVSDGIETWSIRFPDLQTQHSVPLLGLKPADVYTVQVSVTDQAGNRSVLTPTLQAATPSLPADFPFISVYLSDSSRMEPGFTLLDKSRGTGGTYAIVVDNKGDVRWFSTVAGNDGMRQLPNGHLLLLDSSEIDLLGNRYIPRVLQVPGILLHHDIFPTSYGNFISLTLEKKTITGFPTSETDPNAPTQTVEISSDAVVEFQPDGTLFKQWHLTDMLDPHRIGYGSTKVGFPLNDSPDWSHSNGVVYDPSDDSIIVSIRHQDAVVKFARSTGQLIWILGNHDNWGPQFQPYLLKPVGTPFDWQFHQHAPVLTPQGTLLMLDNGNFRASPFDGRTPVPDAQNYSRAVEYAIDPVKMEVRQVWQYGENLVWPLFSPSQGDADWMPRTGNVKMTFTDTEYMAGVPTTLWGFGRAHTAVIEVTHDAVPQKVFEMHVYDKDTTSTKWFYRSERIPMLYAAGAQMFFDADFDGVTDDIDNCLLVPNANQRDTDHDGFGSACDADLNNDGVVDNSDYIAFAQFWQTSNANADLDGDGVVSWSDLQILINTFFAAPGPSAAHP